MTASLLVAALAALAPSPQEEVPAPAPARFAFHNRFWINLHHFLFWEAKQRPDATPSSQDPAWTDALFYYREAMVARDLLFDRGLQALDRELAAAGDDESLGEREIDETLRTVLEAAAPVYREGEWERHRADGAEWIREVEPLLAEHGDAATREVARLFDVPWPKEPIPVDVLVYANWAGAYTTPGHVRIGGTYPRREAPHERFETVVHEAAHLLFLRESPMRARIAAQCSAHELPVPRDLWHALLFFTVGEVAKRSPATPEDYVPYADRHGLWGRGPWPAFHRAIEEHWRPYVDGETELESALGRVVNALKENAPAAGGR